MTIIASRVSHREGEGCYWSDGVRRGSLHCLSHQVDEDGTGAYRVCEECFHVYRTEEELVPRTPHSQPCCGCHAWPR